MVLDLLTLGSIPTVATAIGAAETLHQQHSHDHGAESDRRQAPFYLDVYCDARSSKRDEVHDAIVVLKDGKLRLWPRDPNTNLPKPDSNGGPAQHPFEGFFYPFPTEALPNSPVTTSTVLGLVSTIPPEARSANPSSSKRNPNLKSKSRTPLKPKLNWIYAHRETMELSYGPRKTAREHTIGPWDWTEDDEQGLTLDGEESIVAVEEEEGGYGWAVYWDKNDDRLKGLDMVRKKRVLRCSLERRLVVEEDDDGVHVESE